MTTFKQCFKQNFQWFMRCVVWSLSGHKEPQCCFLPSVPDASEFQACTEGKISCYWALNFYLLLSFFLLYHIFVSPPFFFFSWAFTMLHFWRKSFHENQENCEIISQFTFIIWKGEEMGWSGARLLLEFSVQPCMFFFFGILSHLFNWIVLICVYMSMERWLIHKLGGKVVYDH